MVCISLYFILFWWFSMILYILFFKPIKAAIPQGGGLSINLSCKVFVHLFHCFCPWETGQLKSIVDLKIVDVGPSHDLVQMLRLKMLKVSVNFYPLPLSSNVHNYTPYSIIVIKQYKGSVRPWKFWKLVFEIKVDQMVHTVCQLFDKGLMPGDFLN